MKAALVEALDRPPRYAEFATPEAGAGEALVQVSAAGLHPIVRAIASGQHYGSTGQLPFVPGVDGVGRLADGRRVYFGATRPPYGTLAEFSITRPGLYVALPDTLDEVTAAALANPAMSSRVGLMRAKFVAGESVLVLGATGVAGQLAVQVARRLGAARVVAAGRNQGVLAQLPALGADRVMALRQDESLLVEEYRAVMAEAGVGVVLDYLWGRPAEVLLRAIARKGLGQTAPRIRYVQIGNMAGAEIPLAAATLRSSGLELLGSGFGSASMDEIMRAVGEMFAEAAREPFVTAVQTVPLSQVEAAWSQPTGGTRLVLVP